MSEKKTKGGTETPPTAEKEEKEELEEEDKDNSEEAPPTPTFITQTDADGKQLVVVDPPDEETLPQSPVLAKHPRSTCWERFVKLICCPEDERTIYESTKQSSPLLPIPSREKPSKPCLVLDLDETLVHSSFVHVPEADFQLEIHMDGKSFSVFVVKRPGVEELLKELSEHYELVLFTASVEQYAKRVVKMIDPDDLFDFQLYREHCTYYEGNFVKDLTRLNRPLEQCLIVDNSPLCYQFQPENGIGITSFIYDKSDRELVYLKEFLLNIKESKDMRRDIGSYHRYVEDRYRQDLSKLRNSPGSEEYTFIPPDSQVSTLVYTPESESST